MLAISYNIGVCCLLLVKQLHHHFFLSFAEFPRVWYVETIPCKAQFLLALRYSRFGLCCRLNNVKIFFWLQLDYVLCRILFEFGHFSAVRDRCHVCFLLAAGVENVDVVLELHLFLLLLMPGSMVVVVAASPGGNCASLAALTVLEEGADSLLLRESYLFAESLFHLAGVFFSLLVQPDSRVGHGLAHSTPVYLFLDKLIFLLLLSDTDLFL